MEKKLQDANLIKTSLLTFFGARLFLLISIYLVSFSAKAQLTDFNLQVTKTDETCPGNGTLNFLSSNTTAGATLNYKVYKLPNLTTEIANLSTNFLGGLSNGTYKIIATQSLPPNSNTQTQDIVINNSITPLHISLSNTNVICGNDGTITATIISGIGVFYEIISGPVTRPLQSSNVFTALPAGTYQVRVYDNCGEASVETRTIFTLTPQMSVGSGSFPDIQLPSCNSITATHGLTSPNFSLHYPIQYQFTVYPPDGATPIIINGTVTSGGPETGIVSQVIPFYHNQIYSYDLKITDYCGLIYNVNNNIVNQKINLNLGLEEAVCDTYFLKLNLSKFRSPYTVTFLDFPSGFNPELFNTTFPGNFFATEIIFGEETNPLPMGNYTVQITDACGRSTSQSITLEYVPVEPIVNAVQTGGCASITGNIKIKLPNHDLASATIITAPPEYTPALPQNVSANIIPNEGLQLIGVPIGTYTFILFDTCGNQYTAEAVITASTNNDVGFNSRPDCEIGKGALRIRAASSGLLSVIMTNAPTGFTNALPYDVSSEIGTNGILSLDNLAPGNYTFKTVNGCGFTKSITITVTGYNVSTNAFELFPHCGSFDFFFNHNSNGLAGQSFWLQKFDPVSNTWGHPQTNVAYAEGTIPVGNNSLLLQNNITLYNLTYTGNFRILKRYETFENGSIAELKNCITTLHEFTYTGILKINGLESITCNGVITDIKVLVDGVPPFIFKIIEKNSVPYLVDNVNNSVFTNLDPAVYKFEVTDNCGVIRTYEFDVALLPAPVYANQPEDYILCDDSPNDGNENFTLSSIDAQILGNQPPADFQVAYYISASDANSQTNQLPDIYNSGNQQIFARINHPTNLSCFAITNFYLKVKNYMFLNMDTKFNFCDTATTTVIADSGYDSYSWSDGQTGNTATFNQPGNYTLTFTKEYGDLICSATHDFQVTQSNAPVITEIIVTDWTDSDNSIAVILDSNGIGDYEYSLDNIHFQTENTFYGLPIGAYTVYVQDKNGCGPNAVKEVFLLTYPKFFTPNGDGFNDFWRIKFSFMEPNMLTYIFDRYGKLITGFGANDPGWDGTLNGRPLPSTDYWFLVKRENGKEHRGHFAMKR